MRRHKKSATAWRKRRSTAQRVPQSMNRTEEEHIWKRPHEIREEATRKEQGRGLASDADLARNSRREDKYAIPPPPPWKRDCRISTRSSPTPLAVVKENIRDNSAQREDPIAKELRFDRVTTKMNKNHRRPTYGGHDEATKEEERQKPQTREGAKYHRRRPSQREQSQERQRAKEAGNPKTKKAGRQREQRSGTLGRHCWK